MQSEYQDNSAAVNILCTGVISNDTAMINTALAQGADINAKNIHGKTPLLLALEFHHNNIDLSKKLLEEGADFTIKNPEGKNALEIAQKKSTELYNEILKKIKKLSEHKDNDISKTTHYRINMIELELSQIKTSDSLDINQIEISKGLDKNKESWKTRCKTRIGCIIS
ncbi:MAG: hypothetical protein ISP24_00895 [Rickettsiales bacterium]|nr:hypothetical protein [Rickettsiales bacterium]